MNIVKTVDEKLDTTQSTRSVLHREGDSQAPEGKTTPTFFF